MQRCLQIAKNGMGTTRPNPSVGAVVVLNNKIIGEGFTSPYGGNHAEVNAINSVKDKSVLKEATIYVTLEPCAHFGKTPPCADLIAKHQLKNVVIGCVDTNSLVAGKGIEHLKKAGCKVTVGVLEDACKEHHKRFFTVQNKKRPYIILKWAETKDGFISPNRYYEKGTNEVISTSKKRLSQQLNLLRNDAKPVWISNTFSQQLVHKWRSEEHAILVGTNTVIADNPKLNVRSWTGNNPVRVVLDRSLRIPKDAAIFDGSVPTLVFVENRGEKKESRQKNIIFEAIDFSKNVAKQIVAMLFKHEIQSVIIEGGTQTLQTFIDENLWDEARVFTGNVMFKSGVEAPILPQKKEKEIMYIQKDVLKTYKND